MNTIILPVLALAIMFSSSMPVAAATHTKHFNQSFTSSKQRLAIATPQETASQPIQRKKKQRVATTTSTTTTNPAPSPTPAPVPVPTNTSCTTGWYVTGYFTPIESDYTGGLQTITVGGKSYSFTSTFLTAVKTEGWGKTHLGTYIGYYGGAWHFATAALDAHDTPLTTDAAAIDPALIAFGTKLTISTLPEGFGTRTFTATDIGTGVTGKHIDVYTGEGKAAEAMTYKITGNSNTVCTQ